MTEKEALILLNSLKDFGFIRMNSLLKLYKTPQQILEKGTLSGLQRAEGIGKVVASSIVETSKDGKEKLTRELDLVKKNKIKVISIFDKEYPSLLKATYNPPLLLYVKGEILPEDTISLGIVGSRLSSYYGKLCFRAGQGDAIYAVREDRSNSPGRFNFRFTANLEEDKSPIG